MVIFSAVSIGVTYLIIRIQGSLPLNPQHLGAVGRPSASTPPSSFVTNTNWQNYGGETTMSYFSQIGALTVQQFVTPAVGIAVAIALVRGFSRRNSPTIGNFWVDITRCILYILLPIAFVAGIIFVGQGAVQTLAGTGRPSTTALNGVTQTIPRGPIGFMEAIKQLGTNGGGFLNANSATTFENPTGLTNWLSIYLLLSIPFALTYTFGKMVGSVRHGAALLAAMVIIFGVWVGFTSYAEHQQNPAVAAAGVHSTAGTPRARRCASATPPPPSSGWRRPTPPPDRPTPPTTRSRPIGGMGLLTGMMLGEVTPGGLGQRAVHHPHLRHHRRVHRRPDDRANAGVPGEEDPGQGGETRRPGGPGHAHHRADPHRIAVSIHAGRVGPLNAGPHGFTEILYGLTSQGNNNGSAFGGLTGNTTFYNVIGASTC